MACHKHPVRPEHPVCPEHPARPELLQVDRLRVARDGVDRLSDISFTLRGGEILAVIGPNGAGKTTLLQTLTAELMPAAGSIHFAGQRLEHWTLTQKARHLAILPQTSLLNFPYTVREVIALGRTPHSSGRRADAEVVTAAMALMDITHLSEQWYTHLSGGEKQRTQLARVLTQIWRPEDASPRLLILDEPTSSLDLGHKQQLMGAIQQFAAQGDVGVLLVEHDLAVVANYATTLLALNEGRCEAIGPVAQVLDQALVQRLFAADIQVCVDPLTGKICVGV